MEAVGVGTAKFIGVHGSHSARGEIIIRERLLSVSHMVVSSLPEERLRAKWLKLECMKEVRDPLSSCVMVPRAYRHAEEIPHLDICPTIPGGWSVSYRRSMEIWRSFCCLDSLFTIRPDCPRFRKRMRLASLSIGPGKWRESVTS